MDNKTLSGEMRKITGKGEAGRLRRQGLVPAVVYGKNDPVHISINAKEFGSKVKNISESGLLTVKVGKKSFTVLIKDYQDNPLTNEMYHLDFFEITKGEKLHMTVPVVLTNNDISIGVKMGGLLEHVLHEVEIECLPKNIPDNLVCDVAELNVNESFHVSKLVEPEGVKILTDGERTIVTITLIKEEPTETEAEESEVEVIGEADTDTEGE